MRLRDLGRMYQQHSAIAREADGEKLQALATTLVLDIATSWAQNKRLAGCMPYVAGAGANKSVRPSNCTRVEGLVDNWRPGARDGQRVGMYLRVRVSRDMAVRTRVP